MLLNSIQFAKISRVDITFDKILLTDLFYYIKLEKS